MLTPPSTESKTALFRRMLTPPALTGLFRHSVAWFLGALVLVFVAAPFVEMLPDGRYVVPAAVTLTLIAAVLAVGGRRRSLAVAAMLASPVILGLWLQHHRAEGWAFRIFIFSFLMFLGFVLFQFLRFILRAPRVNSEVLCAGVATYLLLGMWWAGAYSLIARLIPGSFAVVPASTEPLQGFEALYFSCITLTTVGFGDITPVSRPARMLTMAEALVGTLYMAVLVARLVSLHAALANSPSAREIPDGHGPSSPSK